MRIAIDLQGAQGENRQRGIGKYSLHLAMGLVRLRKAHEVFVVLNGGLADSIGPIRAAFEGLLPQDRILVWSAPMPVNGDDSETAERRFQAELLREAFLAALNPDWVIVVSHFEGQGNNAVTSIGTWSRLPTAVVLYDLIPWIHADHYLVNDKTRAWYYSKFDSLKRADMLLAISSSTRLEAISHLGFDELNVVNISAAVEGHFTPQQTTGQDLQRLADIYGLKRAFVMYTGGIDYRKNIDGLIKCYAMLPRAVRAEHQLAIVCYVNDEWREKLLNVIDKSGLERDEVILTGYVSDSDIHLLYNACKLFIFPSWHEGFGLPVLEAMQCGKPVIAANRTSLPEVVGREDALFDPFDSNDMLTKLDRGLTDEEFRLSLSKHSLLHSKNFSWDETARRAWAALEQGLHARSAVLLPEKRLRLAFISPLPPERSGIADYSASLLRELTRWYKIDVFVTSPQEMSDDYVRATCRVLPVETFSAAADQYDRVLYHFGNSTLHLHMFNLLSEVPGVVVLHDFYLSAIQMWSEVHNLRFAAMARALLAERGYEAVAERFGLTDKKFDFDAYPAVLPVIQDSLGVIVHSNYGCKLAEEWYGEKCREKFSIIPFLHRVSVESETGRAAARRQLGIAADSLIVCSFGFVTEAKLVARLIDAWVASDLSDRSDAYCVFVGDAPGDYGDQIKQVLSATPQAARVKITGWVDQSEYRRWLDAADVAVQLRKNSRGETSASVYDCMGKGLPTVVNAHGFAAELDPKAVWMLPDKFTDENLIEALEILAKDAARRKNIGKYARDLIHAKQNSSLCARLYFESIENAYARAERDSFGIAKLVNRESGVLSHEFIDALAQNNPLQPRRKLLLVDVSSMVSRDTGEFNHGANRELLIDLLLNPPQGFNLEPVYADDGRNYLYARQFTLRLLKCPEGVASDEVVRACNGDVYLSFECSASSFESRAHFYHHLRLVGVPILFLMSEVLGSPPSSSIIVGDRDEALRYLQQSGLSQPIASTFHDRLVALGSTRSDSYNLGWLRLGATLEGANSFVGTPRNVATSEIYRASRGAQNKVVRQEVPVDETSRGNTGAPLRDKNLFHILIQDGMQLPSSLPDTVAHNIESLRNVYPDHIHSMHSGDSLREFINEHYDREVVNAFDMLRPYAYKADLGRYCLLHTLGGVYSDLGNRFLRPVSLTEHHVLAAFGDTNGGLGAPWSVNNGIIAVRKNSVEMGLMIKKVLESVRNRFYGRSPLSPTGPDLFGRVLAECYNPLQYLIGDMACITKTFSENVTFVFLEHSGTLVAVRMKSQGGESRELGIELNNNYNDLWNRRDVYRE